MTPALDTVLPIAAVGSGLLFLALAGLIGLMYLLTSSWFYTESEAAGEAEEAAGEVEDAADEPSEAQETATLEAARAADAAAEAERRWRAVVLAVSVAVARGRARRTVRRATAGGGDGASEWRRVGRARRLSKPRRRMRTGA